MQFEGSLAVLTITSGDASPASLSFDYTQADDSMVLVIVRSTSSAEYVTAASFNGSSMTLVDSEIYNGDDELSLWKFRPSNSLATGTYTVSLTAPGATFPSATFVRIAQYSGTKDDTSNISFYSTAYSASPTAFPLTTVADDSWLVALAVISGAIRTFTGSTDGTFRNPASNFFSVCDSGAAEGTAGSKSIDMTLSSTPAGTIYSFILELKRQNQFTIDVSETTSAAEVTANTPAKNVLDAAVYAQNLSSLITSTLADAITLSESIVYDSARILLDVASFSETFFRSVVKRATDALSFSDSYRVNVVKTFSDTSAIADSQLQFSGIWIPRTSLETAWSSRNAPSTSFADRTPPNTSFTDRSAPSTSWSDRTPPTTPWS